VSAHNSDGAWELPHEFRQMQATARGSCANAWCRPKSRCPHDAYALPDDALNPLQEEARKLGFWNVESPSDGAAPVSTCSAGGRRRGVLTVQDGPLHRGVSCLRLGPPNSIFLGRKDQIEKYAVPTMAAGGKTFVAISEPSGGSDPAGLSNPRREEGRPLHPQRHKSLDLGRRTVGVGAGVRAHRWQGARWRLILHRGKEVQGLSYKPIPVIRSYFPYEISLQDCEVPEENASAMRRSSSSPRPG